VESRPRRRSWPLRSALLCASPFAVLQWLLAFHDPLLGRGGLRRRLSARWVEGATVLSLGTRAATVCVPALASAFLSLLSSLLFGALLALQCRRASREAVSRRLAARSRRVGALAGGAPLADALFRGAAALWARPHTMRFELLMAADFAACIVAALSAVLLLSLLPSLEVAAAARAIAADAEQADEVEPVHLKLRRDSLADSVGLALPLSPSSPPPSSGGSRR
jgi:hypothetical protein